jgi:hypothetical protein
MTFLFKMLHACDPGTLLRVKINDTAEFARPVRGTSIGAPLARPLFRTSKAQGQSCLR